VRTGVGESLTSRMIGSLAPSVVAVNSGPKEKSGTVQDAARQEALVDATAVVAASTHTQPATRSPECFTWSILPGRGLTGGFRGTGVTAYFAVMPRADWAFSRDLATRRRGADTASMDDRNVLGGELEPCGTDPLTGFYRDGCCTTGPEDLGSHTICAVMTADFLAHQRSIGNDLSTPVPQFSFPGLVPGDRWCVTAANWLRAHRDGAAAPVVLASTHERALAIVPLEVLRQYSVDVPSDAAALDE
jgi:uncharacterized protein